MTFRRLAKGTKSVLVDDSLGGICNGMNDGQTIPLLIDQRGGCWVSIHRVLSHGAATEYEFRIPKSFGTEIEKRC